MHFNSIKVRLEQLSKNYSLKDIYNFNSIKVRLELLIITPLPMVLPYFNSIKVRLERKTMNNKATIVLPFQFHKGTIRTQDHE